MKTINGKQWTWEEWRNDWLFEGWSEEEAKRSWDKHEELNHVVSQVNQTSYLE